MIPAGPAPFSAAAARRPARRWRIAVVNSHPIQYFAPLYRRLVREPDFDLTVFYCAPGGTAGYHDRGFRAHVRWDVPLLEGYRYELLRNLRRHTAPAGFWSLINPGVIRRIAGGHYDAVWLHGHNHCTTLLALAAARFTGASVLMRAETHLQLRRASVRRWLRPVALRVLYSLCDGCLAIGSRNRSFYERMGVPAHKLHLLPYAVDNDFFSRVADTLSADERRRLRQRLGLPPDLPLVLFAGKLERRKRPGDALAAHGKLQASGARSGLALAGSGPLERELRMWTEANEVPRVHFLGFQNQTEMARVYALGDVLVVPAEDEPWGLVVNEAMAAGLPVVATREIGAAPDLVREGRNGFLYDTGDVTRLTDHLRTLLDGNLRRRMSVEARRIIEGWSFEECVRGLREALRTVSRVPSP